MTWSAYFLTENPDLMTRLRRSVDETLGTRQPEFADLPALTYPRWVMQEALRLYGPIFFLGRKATERDVIDGYVIEPGQDVAILIHNIHRHPDHWKHPETFDPERFSPEQSEDRHQLAWMPFGAGQRQCIGRDFALMEGQFILSKLMQRYVLTAVPERQVKPRIGLTLRTQNGVFVTIKRRETA
jgi:cytochrome P450